MASAKDPRQGDYYKTQDGKWAVLVDEEKKIWSITSYDPRISGGREWDQEQNSLVVTAESKYKIGPSKLPQKETLRYPNADNLTVGKGTDYVLFEFGKYTPPFKNYEEEEATKSGLNLYNNSADNFNPESNRTIVLPMPQDLSTEFTQTWQGKSFTSIGAAAVAALGAGNFSKAGDIAQKSDVFGAFSDAIKTAMLNRIPGVGGNITMNDISGSSRGVILNPNAEVLYEAPNLRELAMVFKMFPRNASEAKNILKICQIFRKMSSPSYGVESSELSGYQTNTGKDGKEENQEGINYIRVPHLCRFHFMTGPALNEKLAQYKPCAITRVQVNYTPDGTYAVYSDGSPVAIELQLRFMETKLIFANEIKISGASF